jgi:hypothetical protein
MHYARGLRAVVLCAVLASAAGCGNNEIGSTTGYPHDDTLRLNQLQALGTHNSYHIQPRPELLAALLQALGPTAEAFEYTHVPLPEQFGSQGIRQIELDVFADPEGGLFANRYALGLIGQDPASGIPALDAPGFKVLHVQDIDFESTCWTFVECLTAVKTWSDTHPGHMPIMILIEAKDDTIPLEGAAVPVPIGAAEFDALEVEIRSVFPIERLITPDDVRAGHASLEAAVRADGWPTLGASRGRVLFTLDNEGEKKATYLEGHPSLEGRLLFTSSPPGEPEAAFVKLNDPLGDFDRIRQIVADGFIVRTRADADTVQARNGDTTMRDAALASGAQFVSTDYPVPDPQFGTGYAVEIPGGTPARCNPISAPAPCTSLDIENPMFLDRAT